MTNLCVYCATNKANTEDHIPSKGLFLNKTGVDFYKIPACDECNRGFSKDEEYFRNLICNLSLESSPDANILFDTKIKRSVQRKSALANSLFQQMQLVDFVIEGGVYIETKTKITVPVEDRRRIENVITKYAKGLFYQHFGKIMPEDHIIKMAWPIQDKKLLPLISEIKPTKLFSDIFAYGLGYVPNTYNCTWLLLFFKKVPFLVFTVDQTFKQRKI